MPLLDSLTAVAAVARNGVIGVGGRLPWHIPEDMRHFREVTMGGALIMGRLTFESLGRPLPGRLCVVVSSRALDDGTGSSPSEFVWVRTFDDALGLGRASGRPVFVVGGGQIYRAAWPFLTDLELTLVDAEPPGDVFFPDFNPDDWDEASRTPGDGFDFVHYRRRDTSV